MKVSFNWIKELVDLPWTPEVTADKLAELGFPVESMTRLGVHVSNVVAVKILSVEKHPNADRLRIAQVTDGINEHTIVCGAPNIAVDQVVPCALPGAKLPGGIEITVSKIRGSESHGMLCSERELGLSEEHAGILQLPQSAPLGKEVKDILGGNDVVLDVEITPNRPDLFSHIGIARELAALAQIPLRHPGEHLGPGQQIAGATNLVEINEPTLCSRYMGKLVHGVKVGASPDWMVKRLQACGIRSINNIVDITNYVLLELGHPLHAFDLAKLSGQKIIVRRAAKGEKILALDEKSYTLEASDLVIADAKNPVAIAGIMGGQESGVTNSTSDILLESAVFDRTAVRLTSKRLALRSESSLRFEKGTDAATAEQASLRAAQLIQELAQGKPGQAADVYPNKEVARAVSLRKKRVSDVIGEPISDSSITNALTRLGLTATANSDGWSFSIPPHRRDLVEEVDLIEEVVRLVGYNNIPSRMSSVSVGKMNEDFRMWDETSLVESLRGFGLSEAMTSSFCAVESAEKLGFKESQLLKIANPISKEETVMRPSLSVNLLKAVQHNLHHQRNSVSLFEIGNVFEKNGASHAEEKRLALVVCGDLLPKTWAVAQKSVNIFHLKGLLEALAKTMRINWVLEPAATQPFLHPNQGYSMTFRKNPIGWAGLLHPSVAQQFDISLPCAIAEFSMTVFRQVEKSKAVSLPKYPFVERDIAIVIDKNKPWLEIHRDVTKAGGNLLVGTVPFDIFEGGSLSPTQKSVAFRVRLQHAEHTLSDAEISGTIEKIKSSLQKNCGAQLR